MNKPERDELFDTSTDKKLIEEFIKDVPNSSIFIVNKEDHTIGNIIRMKLHEDKSVLFAGYSMPHPLEHHILIRIRTTGEVTPRDALITAIKKLKQEYDSVERLFNDELQRFQQEQTSFM